MNNEREHVFEFIKNLKRFEFEAIEKDQEIAPNIDKLCTTRGKVCGNAYNKIIMNFEPLMKLCDLSLSAGKLDTEIKARTIGVQLQMEQFQFFCGLNLGQRLFSITDNPSETFHKESMSTQCELYLAELKNKSLSEMRNEENFKLFFDTIKRKSLI